ncbi:hypothetical protein ACP275_04G164500 [Erythranthe tilingii]
MSKKLMRSLERLKRDPPPGISAAPEENNIMLWNAVINGPDDTPWSGGTFKLTLEFPHDYPFKPPRVRFVSRMFHPNIYEDGRICSDLFGDRWFIGYFVDQILVCIQDCSVRINENTTV